MSGEGTPPAFVSVADLRNAWRALTPAEQTYAAQLLDAAGQKIRDEYRKAFAAEIDDADPSARAVSIDLVRTAISTGAYTGHIQYTRMEGQRQKGGLLANPGGALVLTDWHRQQLGIPITAGPVGYFDGCW